MDALTPRGPAMLHVPTRSVLLALALGVSVAAQVEHLLAHQFAKRDLDPSRAPIYSQMLVGMVALTGQHWADVREPSKDEVAAHLVNLAWNGLSNFEPVAPMRESD